MHKLSDRILAIAKMTKFSYSFSKIKSNVYFKTVIPNRDAGAHKDVMKRCQGCRKIPKLLRFINILLLKVSQIVIFRWVRVPLDYF
jgi:hypothetical protein